MAGNITRTYTFSNGTNADASQVESEVSNIVTVHNQLDAGTLAWTTVKAGGGTFTGAVAMGSNKITGVASATASGDALIWGQAFTAGSITFSPTTSGIVGTTTNDSPTAGLVGEYIESFVTNVNFPTSTQWGDATSISLTAGDWDVKAQVVAQVGATNWSEVDIGISTTSGNSSTGLSGGKTISRMVFAVTGTSPSQLGLNVSYRFSLATTTIVYLKMNSTYTGTPQVSGGLLSARRMR